MIDRYWIVFYWIASNIEYDTVLYFSGEYGDQTAERVFRKGKGVCTGHGNLCKYLYDEQHMSCEIISEYAKGYGYDDRESASGETDHAWNAVQIDQHRYFIDSTWGAGHLNDRNEFVWDLTPYYFLPRPNEMIYHHLPEDEKWQLLRTPINMNQYMQMPKLRPLYFDLRLELINPRNQADIFLLPGKPYALILLREPSDVHIMSDLKLNNQSVEGGRHIMFDEARKFYRCYFAARNNGKHRICFYAK